MAIRHTATGLIPTSAGAAVTTGATDGVEGDGTDIITAMAGEDLDGTAAGGLDLAGAEAGVAAGADVTAGAEHNTSRQLSIMRGNTVLYHVKRPAKDRQIHSIWKLVLK